MPMFVPRMNLYQNTISFPASATTSSATLTSAVFQTSQNVSYSGITGLNSILVPGNSYKLEMIAHLASGAGFTAGSGTITLQGSWDGSAWFNLASDTATLATSQTGNIVNKSEFFPAHATFYRIQVALTGATWTSATVPSIDLVIQDDPFTSDRVQFFGTAVNAAAGTTYSQVISTVGYGSTLAPASNITSTAYTAGSMTSPFNNNKPIQLAYVSTFVVGAPAKVASVTATFQGSEDGVNWYNITPQAGSAITVASGGGGPYENQVVANDEIFATVSGASGAQLAYIGNFFRVNYTTAGTAGDVITCTSSDYIYNAVTLLY
jgi:hypothetical protein